MANSRELLSLNSIPRKMLRELVNLMVVQWAIEKSESIQLETNHQPDEVEHIKSTKST
jgi:hypothetical protein